MHSPSNDKSVYVYTHAAMDVCKLQQYKISTAHVIQTCLNRKQGNVCVESLEDVFWLTSSAYAPKGLMWHIQVWHVFFSACT